MAQYKPHQLSTLLCRLFDSGRCTPAQMAKLLEVSPRVVDLLTNNGMTCNTDLRFRIGAVLSAYHRKFPETRPPSEYEFEQQRKLKIVSEIEDAIVREGTPRGVFEEDDAPAGLKIFKSIDSSGVRRERREVLAADVTRQVGHRILKGMELYLDEVDPLSDSIGTGDT